MRWTVNLDEVLLDEAARLTGIEGRTELLHEALRALIHRERVRGIVSLQGTEQEIQPAPRRRF